MKLVTILSLESLYVKFVTLHHLTWHHQNIVKAMGWLSANYKLICSQ